MQYPPLKAIEAVVSNRVDGRTRRLVLRYRNFFRAEDDKGRQAETEADIVRITLTQRGQTYWQEQGGGRRRIPAST